MTYQIGTPIIAPSGSQGFISGSRAPETRAFVIGAGMKQIMTEYEICFESGRVEYLGDGIVAPFVERAKHLPKVENVDERRAAIKALESENRAKMQRDQAEMRERHAAFREEARKRTPEWAKAVIVAEYVEDRSDMMSDYHGCAKLRTVILGFSRHTRDLFPEMRKFAATFESTAHLVDAPESAEHREKYSMGAGYYLKTGWRNATGWQVSKVKLYNGAESVPFGEWNVSEEPETVAPIANGQMRIEEHVHTKKGFAMFIAVLGDRVERDEFDRLRDRAEALGGWYSRPWAGTPGGFAFKDRAKAESFIGDAAPSEGAPVKSPAIADKFREMANRLQSDIDHKFSDRRTNTPKQQREAASARQDGYMFERAQKAMRALADLHDAGTVPAELEKVRTKAAILDLARSRIDRSNAGYYDAGFDTNEPANDTPAARALWDLIGGTSPEALAQDALRQKVDGLKLAKIPGYFPTPRTIIDRMIDAADIPHGPCDILEPSAGHGAIVDAIEEVRPNAWVYAYEAHASLRDILKAKEVRLIGSDFTESDPDRTFDRVLMNPPFERGQDADHVRRAHALLAPQGRLVAIMSPGPFFRNDRKSAEFRAWFDNLGGEKIDLPAGSFKESGTAVATVLVVIDREG